MASSEMIVTIDMKNLDEVKSYIASLESQLSEARARLAGYEVGFDPNVQMPEFVDGYGWVLARMCEGQNPSMYHYSKFADTWRDVNYNSYPTSNVYCWFPLPGAKEEE